MKKTKYFIEGQAAARGAYSRICRYNKEENIKEWNAGYDSVERSCVVFSVPFTPPGELLRASDLDPVFVGSKAQCEDKLVSLQNSHNGKKYVAYDCGTGRSDAPTRD